MDDCKVTTELGEASAWTVELFQYLHREIHSIKRMNDEFAEKAKDRLFDNLLEKLANPSNSLAILMTLEPDLLQEARVRSLAIAVDKDDPVKAMVQVMQEMQSLSKMSIGRQLMLTAAHASMLEAERMAEASDEEQGEEALDPQGGERSDPPEGQGTPTPEEGTDDNPSKQG